MVECSSWFKKLFRRKALSEGSSTSTPLKRCLSLHHLIFYGVANMAGAGIYVLTGRVIRDQAGPAATLSYVLGSISAVFTACCYAELATLIPKAGSCYTYTYVMLGELPAFIIGWTMLSDILVSMASVAKAFSGTVNLLVNGTIHDWTLTHVGELSDGEGILSDTPDLLAFGFLLFLICVTLSGAHISLTVNGLLTLIQMLCLLIVGVACFVYGSASNLTTDGGYLPFGFGGVIKGASIAVFAFSGFDAVANASEESENPKRDIPISLFTSLAIVSVLYFIASSGLAYLVPRTEIDYSSPFVAGFSEYNAVAFTWIAAIGTLLATGATKVTGMYIVPRMFYAIASDGLIFKFISYVEPRSQVPIFGLLIGGSISAFLALLFNIQTLADFTSMGILFSYFTVGINLIVFRYIYESELSEDDVQEQNESLAGSQEHKLTFRKRFQKLTELVPSLLTWKGFKVILVVHILFDFLFAIIVGYVIQFNTFLSWFFYALLNLGVIISFCFLSLYEPRTDKKGFLTPFMPIAPAMTILVNLMLIVRLPLLTWVRCIIWSFVGLAIYFGYGIRHSQVTYDQDEAIILVDSVKFIDVPENEDETPS